MDFLFIVRLLVVTSSSDDMVILSIWLIVSFDTQPSAGRGSVINLFVRIFVCPAKKKNRACPPKCPDVTNDDQNRTAVGRN